MKNQILETRCLNLHSRLITKRLLLCIALGSLGACKSPEEVLKSAKKGAQFQTEKQSERLRGIGDGLKGSGKEGVKALSEGLGEVIKGAAKGFDSSLNEVTVQTTPQLDEHGIRLHRTIHVAEKKSGSNQREKVLSSYLVFEKEAAVTLILRVLDEKGQEVGRAVMPTKGNAGEATFVDFRFDSRTPVHTAASFEMSSIN